MLKNKNAIITGCNRGIGKAILELFVENGANIFGMLRNADSAFVEHCENLEKQYGVSIKLIPCDVTNSEMMKTAIKSVFDEKCTIDILVNNAGAITTGLFQMTSVDKLRDQMEVNYYAHVLLSQYVAKKMTKQNSGSIVNIASSSGLDHNMGKIAYNASKAAMISASVVMAKELGSHNIRVNAIAPGLTDTDLMRDNTKDEDIEKTIQLSCLKRVGTPREIAKVALFLASDLSDFMTGQTLRVDGGMYIGQ